MAKPEACAKATNRQARDYADLLTQGRGGAEERRGGMGYVGGCGCAGVRAHVCVHACM